MFGSLQSPCCICSLPGLTPHSTRGHTDVQQTNAVYPLVLLLYVCALVQQTSAADLLFSQLCCNTHHYTLPSTQPLCVTRKMGVHPVATAATLALCHLRLAHGFVSPGATIGHCVASAAHRSSIIRCRMTSAPNDLEDSSRNSCGSSSRAALLAAAGKAVAATTVAGAGEQTYRCRCFVWVRHHSSRFKFEVWVPPYKDMCRLSDRPSQS